MILAGPGGRITEDNGLVDKMDFFGLVFEKSFFPGCVQIVYGCFSVISLEILFTGSNNLESGSESWVFEVFRSEILDSVFEQVKPVEFLWFDDGLTDPELEILNYEMGTLK